MNWRRRVHRRLGLFLILDIVQGVWATEEQKRKMKKGKEKEGRLKLGILVLDVGEAGDMPPCPIGNDKHHDRQ